MANRIRVIAALFFLFAAVMVDFINGMMSMVFDAAFVIGAALAVWPMLKPFLMGGQEEQ